MAGRKKKFIVLIIILAFFSAYMNLGPLAEGVRLKRDLSLLPLTLNQWAGHPLQEHPLKETDHYLSRLYTKGGYSFNLFIGYREKFRPGSKVFSGDWISPPEFGWNAISDRTFYISRDKDTRTPVRVVLYKKDDSYITTVYWYQRGQRIITRRFLGRLQYGIDSLLNKKSNVALVRISSTAYRSLVPSSVLQQALSFAEEVSFSLKEFLPDG